MLFRSARDLGERCGPGACLEELRRTRSGEFRIEEAVSLEALDAPEAADTLVIPMGSLLKDFPAVTLSAEGLTRVTHGRSIRPSDVTSSSLPALPAPTWVRLLDPDGDLVAMAVPEPRFDTMTVLAFQHSSTGMPAMGLFGSSCAAGFTMSFDPMTMATSVFGKSSLISSISRTMS